MMELTTECLRDETDPYFSIKSKLEDFKTQIQMTEKEDRDLKTIYEGKIVGYTQNIEILKKEMEEKSYLKRLVKDDQKEIDRNDFDRTKCSSHIHFLEQKL